MSDRLVVVSAEQAGILDDIGQQLLRNHDERATKVLALVLAWRYAATDRSFVCKVDESAGMADVIELDGYSRRIGA